MMTYVDANARQQVQNLTFKQIDGLQGSLQSIDRWKSNGPKGFYCGLGVLLALVLLVFKVWAPHSLDGFGASVAVLIIMACMCAYGGQWIGLRFGRAAARESRAEILRQLEEGEGAWPTLTYIRSKKPEYSPIINSIWDEFNET